MTSVHRVVRADRGAVLVVPDDDLTAPPVRALLDRDGLAGVVQDGGVPDGGVPDGAGPGDGAAGPGGAAAPGDGRLVPAVGDRAVLVERGGVLAVAGLLPRRTALVRDGADRTSRAQVLAAGVDVVLVVEHLDPDPAPGRVERLLTLAWRSGALPVVVLTKSDLVPDPDGMAADVARAAVGVDVHVVSATTGRGLDAVRALLGPGTTVVLVGPSGAGKSTLVNALAGADVMATGGIRADGRGRHTTTHRQLVALPGGAALVDTPGIRGVGLVADEASLDLAFADVADLAGRCRFRDCAHAGEPGCAVAAAVADGDLDPRRLESWRRLAREAAHQAWRADAAAAAAERARVKARTVAYHRWVRGGGAVQRP